MTTSRRRFLKSAAVFGGVTIGQGASAWKDPVVPRVTASAKNISGAELLESYAQEKIAAGSIAASAQSDPPLPTQADVDEWYTTRRNWGRWGDDDQMGAMNLVTSEKRMAAASMVRTGRTVSLSRVFEPAQHFIRKSGRGNSRAGAVVDYYGFIYHGRVVTHIDALCHMWDNDGMWQGRDADVEIDTQGAHWGDITAWSDGIITKGVLLDVARHRGVPHVQADRPVHGWELEEIAESQGVRVDPGDALLVHSGWEAYQEAGEPGGPARPGLHISCAKYIRDHDVALLGWDLMDASPSGYDVPFAVHGVLFNYGVALLDNAGLEPIAEACAQEGRYEFMFMALPLKVARGTGSPVNPIAMF